MYEEELAFANELADRAGEIGLSYFRGSFEVYEKADRSPVTEVDLAIEAAIREAVRERYPGDGVLGEEGGQEGDTQRRWVVDPIDGTKNFADGVQIWSNLIAFEVDGEPVVGVVNLPALGERYEATVGGGARMNGQPIHTSRADRVPRAFVVYAGMEDWLSGDYAAGAQALVSEARRNRGFGDAWGHCLVARGSADVMIELELATWDFAALEVIVTEAGGTITRFDGSPLAHGGTVVSTNGILHDEVVARLAGRSSAR